MSERVALFLALAGPPISGLLLARGVQLLPPARQPLAERLLLLAALALAFALDLRSEGPEHGVFAAVVLFLPGVLAFAIARFFLARRSSHVPRSV